MSIHSDLTDKELLEKYSHIQDDQIVIDYKNTKDEADAYNKLADGYATLSRLPETEESNKRLYDIRSQSFYESRNSCYEFFGFVS